MKKTCITQIAVLVLLVIAAGSELHASEVYHWVDEHGVSHFSQQPPDKGTQNVSTQRIIDNSPSAGAEAEDIYNVAAHEERMAAWREEREQERKDARERKQQAAKQQVKYPQPESYGRRPYLYPPIHRPPIRPPYNPERPIFNPRPPTTTLSGG